MQKDEVVEVVLKRRSDLSLGSSVYVVRGEAAILRLQTLLIEFNERCQNPSGTMLDLPYFLQKPGFLKRVPYLFLVARRSGAAVSDLSPDDLSGTALLMEYQISYRLTVESHIRLRQHGTQTPLVL